LVRISGADGYFLNLISQAYNNSQHNRAEIKCGSLRGGRGGDDWIGDCLQYGRNTGEEQNEIDDCVSEWKGSDIKVDWVGPSVL
jgi:hypothetical protein